MRFRCGRQAKWDRSISGRRPGGGFEYFYGFLGAEADGDAPDLLQGTTPVDPPKTPEEGYHFDEDVADHVIDGVRQQKALMPEKPFFVYYAPEGPMRRTM